MTATRVGLPRPFKRLWAADALSTAGDGFTSIAAPLLVLSLTRNPILIAGATSAAYLPWLVFGLASGAVVDRVDQRRLIIIVDSVRAVLMGLLALLVWTGRIDVVLVYLLLFLSGTGDTLTAVAASTLTPRTVDRHDITKANARLLSTRLVGGALLARPIGAWLFSRGAGTPFVVDAVSFLVGSALVVGLPLRPVQRANGSEGPPVRSRVRDGLAMLWADGLLRTLALCILVMNITLTATTAVLVIVARDRLGLGAEGYGLLLATLAVGGLIGAATVNRLLARFGPVTLLSTGLVLEAATHLGLALTTSPWIAGAVLLVFGVHSSVWSVLTLSLRQQRVADDARGRVTAAYQVLATGGAAVGAVFGGVLVRVGGLTTPMWVGAAVVTLLFFGSVPTLRRASIATAAAKSPARAG